MGLIYDDPWLFGGTVVSLIVLRVLTWFGLKGEASGVLLAVLLFLSIAVSISKEISGQERG